MTQTMTTGEMIANSLVRECDGYILVERHDQPGTPRCIHLQKTEKGVPVDTIVEMIREAIAYDIDMVLNLERDECSQAVFKTPMQMPPDIYANPESRSNFAHGWYEANVASALSVRKLIRDDT